MDEDEKKMWSQDYTTQLAAVDYINMRSFQQLSDNKIKLSQPQIKIHAKILLIFNFTINSRIGRDKLKWKILILRCRVSHRFPGDARPQEPSSPPLRWVILRSSSRI